MKLPVLYIDEDLVVVNKPSGLLVHRSHIDRNATEFAMQVVRDQIGQFVYPVHRLDRSTSGALVFALSQAAARNLSEQFASGQVIKKYQAIVRGWPPPSVLVDHPLTEELDPISDSQATLNKPAQSALTEISTLATVSLNVSVDKFPTARYALVCAVPKTGRKHQIRRHLRHLGHPIVGDVEHGSGRHNRFFRESYQIHRLLLACTEISFRHPRGENILSVQAPLATDFADLVEKLF
jgi:tRNA pseudouridine65 synthase